MRSTSRRVASILAAAAISILAVACAGGSPTAVFDRTASGPGAQPEQPQGAPPVDRDASGGGDGGEPVDGGGGGSGEEGYDPGSPAALQIVRTGEVSIQVGEIVEGVGAVRALATEMGGYVGSSQTSDSFGGATLTLRIPAARFDATLDRLREMGDDVLHEATRDEDVTSAIVDLDARITNLRASEETYRNLLARSERIEDILAVQARLDEVRGQIEQLEAESAYLAEQAEMSTLTVSLVPAPVETSTSDWNPGQAVQQAVAALLSVGQALLTAFIWIAIVFLPILLVIGLIALVVIKTLEIFSRRAPRRPVA